MSTIWTSGDNYLDYYTFSFRYCSIKAEMFIGVKKERKFSDVKDFKIVEGSNNLSSMLLGKIYYVNVSMIHGENLSIKCKNLATAESVMSIFKERTAFGKQKKLMNEKPSNNSKLKKRLLELEDLKKEGLLTEEEYKEKRKQIIDNY